MCVWKTCRLSINRIRPLQLIPMHHGHYCRSARLAAPQTSPIRILSRTPSRTQPDDSLMDLDALIGPKSVPLPSEAIA